MILQIETATTVCSVALAKDGKTVAVKQLDERNIHAEVITLFIDELVASGFEREKEVKKANLEDVFITKTGKALREA